MFDVHAFDALQSADQYHVLAQLIREQVIGFTLATLQAFGDIVGR
jgi:hypothetical protein